MRLLPTCGPVSATAWCSCRHRQASGAAIGYRIISGPFQGRLGIYEGMKAHQRVDVLLALFASERRVELSRRDIVPRHRRPLGARSVLKSVALFHTGRPQAALDKPGALAGDVNSRQLENRHEAQRLAAPRPVGRRRAPSLGGVRASLGGVSAASAPPQTCGRPANARNVATALTKLSRRRHSDLGTQMCSVRNMHFALKASGTEGRRASEVAVPILRSVLTPNGLDPCIGATPRAEVVRSICGVV